MGHVTEELIGPEYLGQGKGYVILSIGLGLLAGPPIAGYTFDKSEDLEIAFYLGGKAKHVLKQRIDALHTIRVLCAIS